MGTSDFTGRRCGLVVTALLCVLTGCNQPPITQHYRELPTVVAGLGGAATAADTIDVPVFFITTRARATTSNAPPYFSHVPAQPPVFTCGSVTGTFNRYRPIGGRSAAIFRGNVADTAGSVWIGNPRRHDGGLEDFIAKEIATTVGRRSINVIVHGFNYDFTDAASRGVSLHHDLGGSAVTIVFSWPTNRKFYTPGWDENQVNAAADDLRTVIQQLRKAMPDIPINLVAHSMGCRVAVMAAELPPPPESKPLVNHLVLAAPDLDATLAGRRIDALKTFANDTTIYVCERDLPLYASMKLHGPEDQTNRRPRLGQGGRYGTILTADHIATIDVSLVEFSPAFHDYVFANRLIVDDLYLLLVHNLGASKRNLLVGKYRDRHFWLIRR